LTHLSDIAVNTDTSPGTCLPHRHIPDDVPMGATIDMVNAPPHYLASDGFEVIDDLEAVWSAEAHLPTAVAYILRHHRKGTPLLDLQKARWWVRRWHEAAALSRGRPMTKRSGTQWCQSYGITDRRLEVALNKIWLAAVTAGSAPAVQAIRRTYAAQAIAALTAVINEMEAAL
jgi:hypothetical protein